VRTIPLVDLPALARAATRTRRARLLLAVLAVAVAATAIAAAPSGQTEGDALLPRNSSTIVVLDVSASISSDTYARIATTLERIARSKGRAGLILFSDTAYQALPPGTPVAELGRFERFFQLRPPAQPGFQPQPPRSPWADAFSAGTRISTGLQLALDVARGDRLVSPAVLLVSDLDDDAGDLESLTSVALAYRRLGVPLRVVGLNPAPEDAQLVQRLLSRGRDLVPASLPGERAGRHESVPLGLIVATAAVAVLAGALLVVTERVRWRSA
jgi:hypothetical protein